MMGKIATVIIVILALCATGVMVCLVGLRVFIWPIIAICVIILTYCAATG